MVKTMEWQGQSLLLLDQTKLPSEIITILCKDYRRVGEAIKRLEVRGTCYWCGCGLWNGIRMAGACIKIC